MLTRLRTYASDGALRAGIRLTHDARIFGVRLGRARFALPNVGLLAVATIVFSQFVAGEMQLLMDTHEKNLIGIGATGLILLVGAYRWAGALPGVDTRDRSHGTTGSGKLADRRGAVIILGLDSAHGGSPAARLLADLPNLRFLALIGTPETRDMNVASLLLDKIAPAAGVNLDGVVIRTWHDGNAESVADAHMATTEALHWMGSRGLDASEMIVDVSAGRRAAAFGANNAADALFVETQYLAADWDKNTNKPIPGTASFKVITTFHD